jgi:hypothetical protein
MGPVARTKAIVGVSGRSLDSHSGGRCGSASRPRPPDRPRQLMWTYMVRRAQLASAGLVGLAGLHVLWAGESSWPLHDKAILSDALIGHDRFPSPAACLAVGGGLSAAAAFVAGWPADADRPQRIGAIGVVGVLSLRGALGLTGLTHLVSRGSFSPRFRRLDRRLYGPICLTLAALAVPAGRKHQTPN